MNRLSRTAVLPVGEAQLYVSYTKAAHPRPDGLTCVIFHGAGQSTSERFASITDFFTNTGISVVALDFLGHGKTGGDLRKNSLTLRTKHAMAAIEHWLAKDTPLVLLGSSMGGHTALQVSSLLGERVRSLCLLQPAIYASEAEDVPFTSAFTEILRQPDSWRSSRALQNAAAFTGKAYIGIGSEDTIIPWSIVEGLLAAFRLNTQALRCEVFHGAAHNLPEWLPAHPDLGEQMVRFITPDVV